MPARKRVKSTPSGCQTVVVIATAADLRRARNLSSPPDLFELRLDCLFPAKNLEKEVAGLPAPIIITARHPAEGGKHLNATARRELLTRFLPVARYLDIELRSAVAFRQLLDSARRGHIGTIISFHNLKSTPSLGSLCAKAATAKPLQPTVFKVATRTDTPAQLTRLLQFISQSPSGLAIAAMGIGKLGSLSRILLSQAGSKLVYTSIHEPLVEGQLSLEHFRAVVGQISATESSRSTFP
jgi:3-dehydroquinate dehydratase-1